MSFIYSKCSALSTNKELFCYYVLQELVKVQPSSGNSYACHFIQLLLKHLAEEEALTLQIYTDHA